MKIYGYELSHFAGNRWLSKFEYEDLGSPPELSLFVINPEEDICEACHLYVDHRGSQYIGFDLALGLSTKEMDKLFCNKYVKKVYYV